MREPYLTQKECNQKIGLSKLFSWNIASVEQHRGRKNSGHAIRPIRAICLVEAISFRGAIGSLYNYATPDLTARCE